MKVEIKVPAMGESITEATVGTLLKSSGAYVAQDEELLELETDKVNQVIYAPQAGVLSWNVAKDETVKIGQLLGSIDTDRQASAKPPAPKAESKPAPRSEEQPKKVKAAAPAPAAAPKEVPPKQVEGVRATKEDFISQLSSAPSPQSAPSISPPSPKTPVPSTEGQRETRKKMSKIRKVIATRLVDALQQTAMLTTFNEVDMSAIMALREAYKDDFSKKYNARLGYMSFFIKASVSAMKAFPEINSYVDGDDIVYRNYFDISVAVGTERGVVVPVIRNCDKLNFAEIEKSLEGFAKKAREGTLAADDLQGGGFTITNGGIYGSLLSTPILNMPQSAILGMHKIEKRAVVIEDQIVIRPMMYLALSYDHRVVNGKEAVSFLVHIKNCLEDPSRILLDV